MLVYLDGHFVPEEEARISVFDHGFLYGDGIYETMRAYGGQIFLLDKHLARLRRSARAIALGLPLPAPKIAEALYETLYVNKLREAYVRLHVSRGPGEIGLDPALCPAPSLVILVRPFKDYPAERFERGVSVAIVKTRRNHPLALPPAVKSTNFINNILDKIESLKAHAYEGIMLNYQGCVAEGTVSNIFMVKRGILYTPSLETGILDGITRSFVLRLARKKRIIAREVQLAPQRLLAADECFLTNTTVEILPVTKIDKKPVGTGRPGPVTGLLRRAYRSEVGACSPTPGT